MWKSWKNLNAFNTLTLKRVFWKTETFLKELEYLFLTESPKTGNATYSYKATVSKANAKTARMGSTN